MSAAARLPPVAAASPVPTGPALLPPSSPPLAGTVRTSGASRVPSVRARDWVAKGFTKVQGAVEVDHGTTSGTVMVGGGVVAREVDLSGTTRVDGDVRVSGSLRSRGVFRAGAGVSAGSARLEGSTQVSGPLAVAGTLQWKGALEVGQDVRAATILFAGRMTVHGGLEASRISGEVDGLSSVDTVRADWVEIRLRKPGLPFPLFMLPPPPRRDLTVQRLEATEVHLAGVRVRWLKADRIWLGPGTHVEFVEGTIMERHKDAHVGPESESPPPPGLTR